MEATQHHYTYAFSSLLMRKYFKESNRTKALGLRNRSVQLFLKAGLTGNFPWVELYSKLETIV
ncbi:hypothetical protein AVU12_gp021 [Pseudomonas phage KPP21]|uniref:Uncharacterized protein n=2 Tax=Luzseptimavirus KPP21 TaxID=1982595 RepID=A0A7S6B6H1_9CAUD|nr:hypothetical protein AVU12_gp021 [Pseudomonas phage KPP21]QKE55985.1 hypothetical protein AMP2_gp037 [Pseudomonas phage vB_Pae_AM.P2]QWY17724.1 hypothetical protein [Pseudomonas phage vB_Pae-PA152]UGL60873.1 hypothetical protein [Pseudomonas phage vB_PaeS_TUMS_P6]UNI71955.1 hypothetical protein [Pseudomonas phage vB_PaeP_TUMS_P10]BAR94580.1 hypothetical protein [Pseudomonas phage KPP21]